MTAFKARIASLSALVLVLTAAMSVVAQDVPRETDEAATATVTVAKKLDSKEQAILPRAATDGTESNDDRDLGSYRVPTKSLNPQPDPDEWQFQLTPYLWIVGISGQAGIRDLVVDVESGLTDSDVHLNFGFMATFEARKNRWIILTDLQYSSLGTERPRPQAIIFNEATADFKTFILDPEIGYRVAQNREKGRSLDVLGGIRYWHLEADINLNSNIVASRFASASRHWVDVVGGVRGRANLTPKFFVVGKGDLGGGGSKFTYQLFGGAGYQFNQTFSILGGYRNLSVNYDKDDFLFDMSLHGPLFGVGIRF